MQWRSPHGRALPVIGQRTLIMGILNVTPDSFSDGGQLPHHEALLARAGAMLADGADVLDIGGESTRPGAQPVTEAEERQRVLPAIKLLRERWPDVPLSIDSFKPTVAEAAIRAGADIINDVWGCTHGLDAAARRAAIGLLPRSVDEIPRALSVTPMAETIARLGCPAILMHNRPDRAYTDFWTDLLLDLQLSIALARRAGVAAEQLWVDPGFGFAKSPDQNLATLQHLERIVALGHPVLVGTSRKSTLGLILGGAPVEDRLEATAATCAWAIAKGCAMIRVHDVRPLARVARTTDAIKAGRPAG